MPHLNYHHLRYFWVIAQEGNLSAAARRLNVSPSALSVQLKQLEEQLGHGLFDRQGKALVLTEAGRIALGYANQVFQSGHELLQALNGLGPERQLLRIGAVATLSRNFQLGLLKPLIDRPDVELIVQSGAFDDLLQRLDEHKLDLVLANQPAIADRDSAFQNTLLAEQAVSLVCQPASLPQNFRFPDDLATVPIVLPGRGSAVRSSFEALIGHADIRPTIIAEIDDMAMLRLFARTTSGVTLVPPVVVTDELRSGQLIELCRVEALREEFYAITRRRQFPMPLLGEILGNARAAR
jgi:LysR family transcriptional activator of nhaA